MRLKQFLAEGAVKYLSQQRLLVNPKPNPHELRQYRELLREPHATDAEILKDVEDLISEFLHHLKKDKRDELPLTYRDPHGSYAYTISSVNPLVITASDSSKLKCKYLMDLGEYAENFNSDILEMDYHWALEHFTGKTFNQAGHEGARLRGE
jgi:hypothetical protein